MPEPPSTRDSWLRLLEPSTSLEEVWAHLADAVPDGSRAGDAESPDRRSEDAPPGGTEVDAVGRARSEWRRALRRASGALEQDARGLALHWAESLPVEGGPSLDAWVAEVALERWHERVDGARLEFRGVDGDGQPLEGGFDSRWESSTLGLVAPAAMALFHEGALFEIVLRLVAARLVIAAVEQLDADLLRAGAASPPTLWVSGDAPPALRLGVWEPDGWTAPPGWFD